MKTLPSSEVDTNLIDSSMYMNLTELILYVYLVETNNSYLFFESYRVIYPLLPPNKIRC